MRYRERSCKPYAARVLIETGRLVLRRLAMGDLDEFVVLHRDPEVVRFVGALDRVQAKERLQASEREWGARGHGLLAVLDRSSDRLLVDVSGSFAVHAARVRGWGS